jgi:hypothetical protein
MDIKYEKTKFNILCWCIEDWIYLFNISSFVEEFYLYEDFDLIQKTTLEITQKLLEKDLIVAGDLLEDNSFIPWNKNVPEIISEIKSKWDSLDRELIPGDIVWFDITEKGKKEFEYLKTITEIQEYIYYIRICDGGQKAAEELLNKLTKDAELIKTDRLRKIKVYKLSDNTQFAYREHSKFKKRVITIDIRFAEIKKNIQFKFMEDL